MGEGGGGTEGDGNLFGDLGINGGGGGSQNSVVISKKGLSFWELFPQTPHYSYIFSLYSFRLTNNLTFSLFSRVRSSS